MRNAQLRFNNHKKAAVHREMMMAISPICDPKQWVLWEVDHIGGITGNNDISNLRWVLPMTNKENYTGKKQMDKNKKSIG